MAPEIFKAICLKNSKELQKIDFYRADVFNMGLIILNAGLLTDPTIIYNK